jgi:hypothetical protein
MITQMTLSTWSDLIFHSSCPIGVLFNYDIGGAPFIHAFIIGLPLAVLAGSLAVMLAWRQVKKMSDAIILGGTAGIMSAIVPYGSAWALYSLFAIYWVEQPFLIAYLGMVLLGIAVFAPPAALGAYYSSRKKFTPGSTMPPDAPLAESSSISRMIARFKVPLIVTLILALTILRPLAVALAGVRLGWVV